MKVCIIGAGPSGLYLSKFLSQSNHFVTIFEKENTIGGLYRFSQLPESKLNGFKNILKSKNIELFLNTPINQHNFKDIEPNYDAFVIATGGVPVSNPFGNENIMDAVDVIKRITMDDKKLHIGRNVLIIGMGNVSLDLVKLLFGGFSHGLQENLIKEIKNIDVTSRSNLLDSKFTNPVMREVIDLKNISIKVHSDDKQTYNLLVNIYTKMSQMIRSIFRLNQKSTNVISRSQRSRMNMFNMIDSKPGDRSLNLLFNTQINEIKQTDTSFRVVFNNGLTKTYDTIVSALGFRSNPIKLDTKKPVYKIGWCSIPRGNISDALNQAKILSLDIENALKNTKLK